MTEPGLIAALDFGGSARPAPSGGDLRWAAEVAITFTAGGIMPVTLIDGQPVGPGTLGPRTTSLRERYWAATKTPSSLPRSATTAKGYKHARSIQPRPSPSVMKTVRENARRAAVLLGL